MSTQRHLVSLSSVFHRWAVLFLLVPLAMVVCASGAWAQTTATLTTIHSFNGINGSDGQYPYAALIQGIDGNFYGTTQSGGANGKGTVFRVTPAGALTLLSSDVVNPYSGLIQASDGNFYGTSEGGGKYNDGAVYRLAPDGTLTILYSFGGGDGGNPESVLVQGSDGNFYGTAFNGGTHNDGTVFRITPDGTLTTLHSLDDSEGKIIFAGLTKGDDGNFYGTTNFGGANSRGTVFRVTPAGALTNIHSFAVGEGASPTSGLVRGSDGDFYGTTQFGGSGNVGTVFRITPDGALTVLHDFKDSDGSYPYTGLIQASDGNFYGTTSGGGTNGNYGTIFRMTPDGTLTTLYSFSDTGGREPLGGLLQAVDGSFYGTTYTDADNFQGTVFHLVVSGVGPAPSHFFTGQTALSNGVYYLNFANGDYFGYYSFLTDPRYLYHFDLGYEYAFDADDGKMGVHLYDFKSGDFFYTSPIFPFPYLYDFTLSSVLYYYPDPNNAGHYNTNGIRYFYDFNTGKIITR